jgi:hypothetical protein
MILQSPPRRQPRQNERTNATSDRAAAQACRTLAGARPAAGLEPRAAGGRGRPAAEAQGAHESPAARPLAAARGEAREAPPGRASPQEPDEARMALARGHEPPLAQEREAQAAELERAGPRPAAELRHWAWAPGCLLALAAPASGLEQGPLVQ